MLPGWKSNQRRWCSNWVNPLTGHTNLSGWKLQINLYYTLRISQGLQHNNHTFTCICQGMLLTLMLKSTTSKTQFRSRLKKIKDFFVKLIHLAASATNSSYNLFAFFNFYFIILLLLTGFCLQGIVIIIMVVGMVRNCDVKFPESQLTKLFVTVHCYPGRESKVDKGRSLTSKYFPH